jgi:hypothetical protein
LLKLTPNSSAKAFNCSSVGFAVNKGVRFGLGFKISAGVR